MGIENLRIAKSALTDEIFAGYIDKTGKGWKTKKKYNGRLFKGSHRQVGKSRRNIIRRNYQMENKS